MTQTIRKLHSIRLVALAAALMPFGGCGGEAVAPPPPPRAATPIDAAATAAIAGQVLFKGNPPAVKSVKMAGTPECAGLHSSAPASEEFLMKDGKLANVFVHIKSGLEKFVFPVPEVAVTIDQKGCMFVPHVAGVQVNQKLNLVNSDPVLHNIHSTPREAKSFNIGFPFKGISQEKSIDKPEVMIPLKCDVHGWMKSYLGAVDHPFFHVTGADGAIEFKGVPAGEYTVEAWHELLGTQTRKVKVEAAKAVKLEFTFEGK